MLQGAVVQRLLDLPVGRCLSPGVLPTGDPLHLAHHSCSAHAYLAVYYKMMTEERVYFTWYVEMGQQNSKRLFR